MAHCSWHTSNCHSHKPRNRLSEQTLTCAQHQQKIHSQPKEQEDSARSSSHNACSKSTYRSRHGPTPQKHHAKCTYCNPSHAHLPYLSHPFQPTRKKSNFVHRDDSPTGNRTPCRVLDTITCYTGRSVTYGLPRSLS